MKNTILGVCAIAFITFAACTGSSSEGATNDESSATVTPTKALDTNKSVWNDTPALPGTTIPVAGQPAKSTAGTAGLNPAHGQPNHRCDIAVGAPLSSPVQQPTQQIQPSMPPTQPAPATSKGTGKLNPAHGQPGHDCAIPVGQPLKG